MEPRPHYRVFLSDSVCVCVCVYGNDDSHTHPSLTVDYKRRATDRVSQLLKAERQEVKTSWNKNKKTKNPEQTNFEEEKFRQFQGECLALHYILPLAVFLLCSAALIAGMPVNDTDDSLTSPITAPYIEILRGRDGRDGRDGALGPQGPRGPQGATGLQGPPGPRSAGVTYTRWGKDSCPDDVPGTELVYAGRAGGSLYDHRGGGANYLCMPEDPEYTLTHSSGVRDHSYVYGTEYERPISGTHNHNVPCAVCIASTRVAVMMIPAKTTCPPSWTREYYGYLTSAHKGHQRTMFECVDKNPDSIRRSQADTNGALFYHVEAHCNGMPCPPYDPEKELNCVVCTK